MTEYDNSRFGFAQTTRDGTPVRIYAVDGAGDWPIHGALFHGGGWWDGGWVSNGRLYQSKETNFDIMPLDEHPLED